MTELDKCYLGDCVDVMSQLIDDGIKVQTIVTSPPYYGLRNYNVDGQYGQENTPQEYIENMVKVFSAAKDLLADDGVLWLNIGDSYYNYRPGAGQSLIKQTMSSTKQDLPDICARRANKFEGIKEKDLIGIPWMLAFALRADGWYLRQEIIWAKPNVMPESVKDRCTKSHESIFMLTKNPRYYFNNEAIKEPSVSGDGNRPRGSKGVDNKNSGLRHGLDGTRAKEGFIAYTETRNKRDVWFIPSNSDSTESGGHFATFPTELVENCILAASKVGDIVFDPFMGSGTVAKVAQNLGRKWLGAELNPEYIKIQKNRTQQTGLELHERPFA